MSSRSARVIFAFLSSTVLLLVLVMLRKAFPADEGIGRLITLLGGNIPAGIIQGITYFIAFFAFAELIHIERAIQQELDAFDLDLLPVQEQLILTPVDVNEIKLQAIAKEKKRKYLITDLIKKACTKYRASHSTSEALEIVSSQSKLNIAKSEAEQSLVRYSAWAIPSVGFIGTVIGIAQSLSYADEATNPEGIKLMTYSLNIAFDTTLISLLLSVILMLYYHIVQEKQEKLHIGIEEYVIENLINRIYNK